MHDDDPLPVNARRFAAVAAFVGWAALVLQLVLSIELATTAGRSAAWGALNYLSFYTVLTNFLVAFALTAAATGAQGAFWRFFRRPGVATAIAASIAVVGLSYHFLLRNVWDPQGLLWLCNALLHYVMPVLYLVYWWIGVRGRGVAYRDIPTWWVYPIAYLVYSLARGMVEGVYPYPFIDASTIGYPRLAMNSVALLVVFTLIAALLVALGRAKPAGEQK
ncbi:hypothetical protein SRS16CHR_00851 [Variovorax sp. SRS16]|uniref:Pr6Pr family membrane protein n=1 Tax=Variovorax sp. SRS16 TaxID=282217 RepID=UPI00131866D0|nr:Pr6Pr family membrane protein [Variovorax sp. SRS16]VTU13957.1 hypothetical protein SRS16CHR_00851 [Variovorax sp. SRS16]